MMSIVKTESKALLLSEHSELPPNHTFTFVECCPEERRKKVVELFSAIRKMNTAEDYLPMTVVYLEGEEAAVEAIKQDIIPEWQNDTGLYKVQSDDDITSNIGLYSKTIIVIGALKWSPGISEELYKLRHTFSDRYWVIVTSAATFQQHTELKLLEEAK